MSTGEGLREEQVAVSTLDDFASQKGIANIDLLKIDVEGHELAVLKGGGHVLDESRVRAVLIEVGFFGSRHTPLEQVRELLEPRGFVLAGYHDQRADPATGKLHHANALFIQQQDAPRSS